MNEIEFKKHIKKKGEVLLLQHWIGHAIAHNKDIVILIEFDTSVTSLIALKEMKDTSQEKASSLFCWKRQWRKVDEKDTNGDFWT